MPLRHIAPALRKGVVVCVLVAVVCSANHFCRDAPGTVEEQLAADPALHVDPKRYSLMTVGRPAGWWMLPRRPRI